MPACCGSAGSASTPGSNLEATGTAALAFVNTLFATAVAALAWTCVEWMVKGKPSMLGGVSGAVAGLVAITPAAGFVGPMGRSLSARVAGVVCLWAVSWLKGKLGYDDALDVFGIHAIGGTCRRHRHRHVRESEARWHRRVGLRQPTRSVTSTPRRRSSVSSGPSAPHSVWSAVVAFVLFKLIDIVMGLRVSEEAEREGLDVAEHGEKAYNM